MRRLLWAPLLVTLLGCPGKPQPSPPPPSCDTITCPPNLTCREGQCIDACAGVTCPPGVPCRDGICHEMLEQCGPTWCQQDEQCIKDKCVPKPYCSIIPERLVVPTALMDNQLRVPVEQAQAVIGDVCGRPPDESNCRLADELVQAGYTAIVVIREDGSWADAVLVRRDSDGLYEEQKAIYYGSGCWIVPKLKGVYERALF